MLVWSGTASRFVLCLLITVLYMQWTFWGVSLGLLGLNLGPSVANARPRRSVVRLRRRGSWRGSIDDDDDDALRTGQATELSLSRDPCPRLVSYWGQALMKLCKMKCKMKCKVCEMVKQLSGCIRTRWIWDLQKLCKIIDNNIVCILFILDKVLPSTLFWLLWMSWLFLILIPTWPLN